MDIDVYYIYLQSLISNTNGDAPISSLEFSEIFVHLEVKSGMNNNNSNLCQFFDIYDGIEREMYCAIIKLKRNIVGKLKVIIFLPNLV